MIEHNDGTSCFLENQHISCFELLNDDEKQFLLENQYSVSYKKGEIICKQGSFSSHIILLTEGLARVYLEGNQKNLVIKIVPSHQLIGLPSIYDGNNRFVYSVSTYTHAVATLIDINVLKQILKSNPLFAMKIINIINEDTSLIYRRFFSLTMKQSHGRMADILLCLTKRVYKSNSFRIDITRNDLADLTGLSSESVIRILKEFKSDGLIKITGKIFEIQDIDRLERISELG